MSTLVVVYLFQGPAWIFANMCVCIMETWSNICPKFVTVLFHLSVCESLHQRECLKKKKVFSTEETKCPLKVPANHMRKRETWVFEIGRPTKSSRQKRLQISLLFLHTTHLIDDLNTSLKLGVLIISINMNLFRNIEYLFPMTEGFLIQVTLNSKRISDWRRWYIKMQETRPLEINSI